MGHRFRSALAALTAALAFLAAPALAQNYTVKDAAGTTRTFCSYIVTGTQYPCPVIHGDNAGAPQALQTDGSNRLKTSDTQSGTWNVGLAGAGVGTAGTPSSSVLSVQGVTSMTALKVDGSAVTQPVSGTVTANAGTGTLAVSAASLPLPSGAATSAKQPALGTAGTASADVITVQGITSMTALKVDGSAVTQPISGSLTNISGTVSLPTGASTEATLAETHGTKAAGTAATKSDLIGGVFNTSLPTLTTGQQAALQFDSSGRLINVPTVTDGADVAEGAKADSACAAPGNTCSVVAVLKGILTAAQDTTTPSPVKIDQTTVGTTNAVSLAQVGATTVASGNGVVGTGVQRVAIASDNSEVASKVADGSNVAMGAKADAACGTAAGTCSQTALIKFLNTNVTAATPAGANIIGYTTSAFDVQTTITRPANTTAYTAADALGGAIDLGVLGLSAGSVEIKGVQLEADIAAIPASQTSWVLYLYSVTPPSATADNGAWDLPSGDRASFLGSIAIPAMADLGSTLYVESNGINKRVKLAGTHLFAYLVTVAGFTPAANSEVYKLTVHTVVQ